MRPNQLNQVYLISTSNSYCGAPISPITSVTNVLSQWPGTITTMVATVSVEDVGYFLQ